MTTEITQHITAASSIEQLPDDCQTLKPMVIDKGVPGESVLAHIITSKFADHNPLNRLEGIFKRHGVEITVSNMCDWVGVSADLLKPLVGRMHDLIRQSPVIHTDDSATSKGWRVQWELVPSG